MKLIVADDSRLVRGIVVKAVASIGFEAVPAANGREALNILEAGDENINLVLLDWNMPVMNGIDVIKSMRADDRFKKIPVLMVSTESEDDRINEAISAGAQNYLTKPFTADQLIDAIHQVLGRK
ncbi:MAG: response regulator [Deltaproteobacteria bacterium HGW-Deltaproteobacteria-6]|jgi:two-component system chemotaxis response regulator CheY|nr:MAG: response regulator [Deltaproteobacteria bacterium HGW-Deltaproteobacteria-6]